MWIAISAVLAVALAIAVAMLWSVYHIRTVDWSDVSGLQRGQQFEWMAARLTLDSLAEGNKMELLHDGEEFFPALLEAFEVAEHSIHFETFLWKTGEISKSLVDMLTRRAKEGIAVRMLLDGNGCTMSDEERERVLAAGIELALFKPAGLRTAGNYNQRDHRKLAITDGRVAFAGGHCITDKWAGRPVSPECARDISVRIEGPIVAALQAAFSENWTEETGKPLIDERLFPRLEPAGEVRAHIAYINVARRISSVKTLHMLAINSAKKSITIQNPYFIPDPASQRALKRAVDRGVKVRVMVPTMKTSDNALVQHAMHHAMGPILQAGIELYGFDLALLHQKVFVVDDDWACVGSTNFDFRSFETNDEISVSIFDKGMAQQLLEAFERDLEHCKPFSLQWWKERSLKERIKDRLSYAVRWQL